MDSFTITLPSNVKSREHNRIGHYYTHLAKRLNLKGKWKVALLEITYPKTFYNMIGTSKVKLITRNTDLIQNKIIWKTYPLPGSIDEGYYERDELITELSKILDKSSILDNKPEEYVKPEIEFDKYTNKVRLVAGNIKRTNAYPLIEGEALNILGLSNIEGEGRDKAFQTKFENWLDRQMGERYTAENIVDMNRGIHSLFVYTNIIQPNYVGDTMTKLLRVVEIPSKSEIGDQITIRFQRLIFQPLIQNEFEMIEVDIKDGTGETVAFQSGLSIVTLLFQKDE